MAASTMIPSIPTVCGSWFRLWATSSGLVPVLTPTAGPAAATRSRATRSAQGSDVPGPRAAAPDAARPWARRRGPLRCRG